MTELRLALLGDGSSDQALVRVVEWVLRDSFPDLAYLRPRFVRRRGRLTDAIPAAIDKLGPDVLFVHRDSERETLEARRAEIRTTEGPLVRVVPVRMTEAWLLFDRKAIRTAAGNPNGTCAIELPRPRRIEELPDPKSELHRLLLLASELRGPRRQARFEREIGKRVQRVSESIENFSPLRRLEAFTTFEKETRSVVQGWIEVMGADGR